MLLVVQLESITSLRGIMRPNDFDSCISLNITWMFWTKNNCIAIGWRHHGALMQVLLDRSVSVFHRYIRYLDMDGFSICAEKLKIRSSRVSFSWVAHPFSYISFCRCNSRFMGRSIFGAWMWWLLTRGRVESYIETALCPCISLHKDHISCCEVWPSWGCPLLIRCNL